MFIVLVRYIIAFRRSQHAFGPFKNHSAATTFAQGYSDHAIEQVLSVEIVDLSQPED